MTLRVICPVFAGILFCIQALGGPSTTGRSYSAPSRPFNDFTEAVSKKTGFSEERIRREAINALRFSRKFSESELLRIERGQAKDFSLNEQAQMVRIIQGSKRFRVNTGLTALYHAESYHSMARSFESLADAPNAARVANLKSAVKVGVLHYEADLINIKAASPEKRRSMRNSAAQKYLETVKRFLTEINVPFKVYSRSSRSALVIPYEFHASRAVDLISAQPEFKQTRTPNPAILIDPVVAREKTVYDRSTKTLYLGTDVLFLLHQ